MPEQHSGNAQPWYMKLLSGGLWLVSAGLGLYAVYSVSKLSTTIYALFGKDYNTGVLIGQVGAVVACAVWIVAVMVMGETLLKPDGKSNIWRLLSWTISIELLIVVLGIIFG